MAGPTVHGVHDVACCQTAGHMGGTRYATAQSLSDQRWPCCARCAAGRAAPLRVASRTSGYVSPPSCARAPASVSVSVRFRTRRRHRRGLGGSRSRDRRCRHRVLPDTRLAVSRPAADQTRRPHHLVRTPRTAAARQHSRTPQHRPAHSGPRSAPVVLADLLGLHPPTIERWRVLAGGGPATYAAASSHNARVADARLLARQGQADSSEVAP
jgi:hypothetical protein